MKRNYLLLLLFFCSFIKVYSQQFFSVNKDSTKFNLTIEGASFLSSLPLKCLQQEYPNKTSHVSSSDSDQLLTPYKLHPAFYGCFDWHSSVHGYWMLVKLLKEFPLLPEAGKIRNFISGYITNANIIQEIKYFVFFFSSRRRHTRSLRDWSSDVCSSD